MRAKPVAVLLALIVLPSLLHARAHGEFTRTLKTSGRVNLDLTTGSGDVVIKAGGSDQVVIHGRVESGNDWFSNAENAVHSVETNPPIEQNGNSIRIGYNLPEDARHHVSISYEVTVPPDTVVQAHSGSGTLEIEGVRSGVKLNTGSGDVRLRDVGGGAAAHTGSGTIRGDGVSAPFNGSTGSGEIRVELAGTGDVDVHTGSGSIQLRGVRGGLHGRTGSGDIQVDGDVKGPWQLHTGSGGVRMALGSSGGFDLDVHTSSGSIHSDLPITVQGTLAKNQLKGAVRGGGPTVQVSTGSGDIDIR